MLNRDAIYSTLLDTQRTCGALRPCTVLQGEASTDLENNIVFDGQADSSLIHNLYQAIEAERQKIKKSISCDQ